MEAVVKRNFEKKRGASIRDMILLAALALIIIAMGFIQAGEKVLSSEVFLPGSSINGIDISGMAFEQALQALTDKTNEQIHAFEVDVRINGEAYPFNGEHAGLRTDAADVYALAIGSVTKGNVFSRLNALYNIRNGIELDYTISYDKAVLEGTVEEFSKQFAVAPADATATFYPEEGKFGYTTEKKGMSLDVEELTNKLWNRFESRDMTPVSMDLKPQDAVITVNDLKEKTALIATYETAVEPDQSRDNNIDLILQVLDGQEIKPGETFSVNDLTGPRTAEKGYREANVIYSGEVVKEFGGGICQATSTLYNAALLAGMNIAERNHHSIPVNYVPIGQDSTVDFASKKDLKIDNTTEYPLYISIKRSGEKIVCNIFGVLPPETEVVEVESIIKRTIPAGEPNYIYDTKLIKGKKIMEKGERDGYQVETYRVYYVGGAKVREEKVSADYYKPQQATYRVGTKSGDGESK